MTLTFSPSPAGCWAPWRLAPADPGRKSIDMKPKTLLTREPGRELATGPNSRRKTRHPVDDAHNFAACSQRRG
jgi:hypothetical protein